MKQYQDLNVWQKGIDLSLVVYRVTEAFPDSEKFGLVSQMRRCSVSVPSNIAEGYARKGDAEFIRFLRIAYGSISELETQILIAHRLNFISEKDFATVSELIVEVKKMLNKFMSTLAKD